MRKSRGFSVNTVIKANADLIARAKVEGYRYSRDFVPKTEDELRRAFREASIAVSGKHVG